MTKVYPRYENCTFDNFKSEQNVDVLKNPRTLKNNVVITGGVGTGKTHLAFAILNQEEKKLERNGYRYYSSSFVRYVTVKEMIDNVRKCWSKTSDSYDVEEVNKYKEIPLLIIDEIGVQYGSDSERIELFEIFNERYNNMLPSIVISNYNRQQIAKTLGLRITDRLYGGATEIELTGTSRR